MGEKQTLQKVQTLLIIRFEKPPLSRVEKRRLWDKEGMGRNHTKIQGSLLKTSDFWFKLIFADLK